MKNHFIDLCKRQPIWALSAILTTALCTYWLLIASPKYVSSSSVIISKTKSSASAPFNIGSMLTGSGSSDLYLFKEYAQTTDILRILDKKLDLVNHYSSERIDLLSRFYSKNEFEDFHKKFQENLSIDIDEYGNIIHISISAYDGETAKRINEFLITEVEKHINKIETEKAKRKIIFLEKQVEEIYTSVKKSRQALLEYQDTHGYIEPQSVISGLGEIIIAMESELAKKEMEKSILESYLSSNSEKYRTLETEIASIKNQIKNQKNRLIDQKNNKTLNNLMDGYKSLEIDLEYNLERYTSALTVLQAMRLESSKNLSQIFMLQTPSNPKTSTKPERIKESVSSTLTIVFICGILSLLSTLIKEHND